MARSDGENWLRERPYTDDSLAEESRGRLGDKGWWLIVLVAALGVGAGSEGIGAVLGDGSFDLSGVAENAAVGFGSLVVTTLILAAMRS